MKELLKSILTMVIGVAVLAGGLLICTFSILSGLV